MSNSRLFPSDDDQSAQVIQRVVASGLPLATGLRAYAEECPLQAKSGLLQLASSVESGALIADAVEQPGLRLPAYLHELIDGGLRAHCLGPMLEEYLHQRRLQRRMGQKVALDVAYPVFILYYSLLSCFGLLVGLVPRFTPIFEGFGVELPLMTQALIAVSNAVIFLEYPIGALLLVAGAALAVFIFGGRWSLVLIDRIPFFGTSARYASMSEFCSLLAPLVETAVPLPEALHAVASTMQPSRLKSGAQSLADHYDGSLELATAARDQGLPKEVVHLLKWENRGAAFGEILRSWAELFARMSAARSSVITAILTPFLMVGIGLLVGIIVISLFLPLLKLLNALS